MLWGRKKYPISCLTSKHSRWINCICRWSTSWWIQELLFPPLSSLNLFLRVNTRLVGFPNSVQGFPALKTQFLAESLGPWMKTFLSALWCCCSCLFTQSRPTLCNPMDCSLPGSSVHGISQARSGKPFPSPGDLSHPGIKPASPALAGGFFTTKPPGKPMILPSKFNKKTYFESEIVILNANQRHYFLRCHGTPL